MARLIFPARRLILPSVQEPAPNVTVNNLAQLEAAITAAPAGAGDYRIRINPGSTYGRTSILSGLNKPGTRLRLQGDRDIAPSLRPVMRGFNAPNMRTPVSFEFLTIEGNALDQFGFPTGASSGTDPTRGLLLDDSEDVRIWGCHIKKFMFNVQFRNAQNFEVGWTTIREWAVDGIRTFGTSPNVMRNVHKHHVHYAVKAESGTPYPDLSARGLSYVNDRRVPIDPRRSDQRWTSGDYANAPVMNLAGNMIPVSENERNGRHPDCDQTAGAKENFSWTECLFETDNLYCHGNYNNNSAGNGGGWGTAGGLLYKNCEFHTAHNHCIAWMGDYTDGVTLDGVLIRAFGTCTWALNRPGVPDDAPIMRPGISVSETVSTNLQSISPSVVWSPTNSFWQNYSRFTGVPITVSATATPPGWAFTDVGSRNIGHMNAPAAP